MCILESGRTIRHMVMALTTTQMELSTRESGLRISNMVWAMKSGRMGPSTRVNM